MPRLLFLVIISLVLATKALAIDPIFTPWFNNLAIRGYDPVAYFTQNEAVEGKEAFEFEWQGATWRFASDENRMLFSNSPEAYAPQYGGYCAYAVAENSTASIDPEQFSIVDGKLYLNYNEKIQEKWLRQRDGYIEAADSYWPDLLKE